MKAPLIKLSKPIEIPVFPQTLHRVRPTAGAKAKSFIPDTKPAKRDNTFSKSRDTREDRASRQMKTTRNPQTFSRGR